MDSIISRAKVTFFIIRFILLAVVHVAWQWTITKVQTPGQRHKNNKFLQGHFEPVKTTDPIDAWLDLSQSGVVVPKDVPNGLFVRIGPSPAYPYPGNEYHWFDGDGVLHGVQIEDGRVRFVRKFVETDILKMEKEQQTAAVLGINSSMHAGPLVSLFDKFVRSVSRSKLFETNGTANTNIIAHAGKLRALVESSLPTLIDLPSLDTTGLETFGGKLTVAPISAHPKKDPTRNELRFFGYSGSGKLRYGIVDAKGELMFDTDGLSKIMPYQMVLMHDFCITENFTIFAFFPLVFDKKRIGMGEEPVFFDRNRKTHFAVIPRLFGCPNTEYADCDAKHIKWFDADPCYVFHFSNAYEENGSICISGMALLDGLNMESLEIAVDVPYEWKLDLSSGKVESGKILGVEVGLSGVASAAAKPTELPNGEFPQLPSRLVGQKHRYFYYAMNHVGEFHQNGLVKYDTERKEFRVVKLAEGQVLLGEAQVVPKTGSTEEDDVYLIGYVGNDKSKYSSLMIIDGKTMSMESAIEIPLPTRIPSGFHSSFVHSSEWTHQ